MITHYTEDTLVKITGLFWTEVDDNSLHRMRLYCAYRLTKAESVARISVELKLSR
jgi:hypothetical protein